MVDDDGGGNTSQVECVTTAVWLVRGALPRQSRIRLTRHSNTFDLPTVIADPNTRIMTRFRRSHSVPKT
jgi:hypothetical protein